MPFTVVDRVPARIAHDFQLQPAAGYVPTALEQDYLDALERAPQADGALDLLIAEETRDRAAPGAAANARVQARTSARATAVAELRADAVDFATGQVVPEIARDRVWIIFGKYVAARDRLARSLFAVWEKLDEANQRAVDVLISLTQNLPPPDDKPSKEKQDLYVALTSATTVLRTVCQRMRERADWPIVGSTSARARAERLLDEYVHKLAGIGRVGLEGSYTELATLALAGLKNEFVSAQAGRIKNAYVRSLGLACGIAALIIFLIYTGVETHHITAEFWVGHKAFLLAAAGAAIGTWLSFSIRRVELPFENLAVLEEDLLDPSVRVIFVIGLTLTACLLFWTGIMNIEIGNLKTSDFAGATAFLIGVFSGISERALATAISGRAAAFVKSISVGS
jgi:hypothetical protein